MTLFLVESEIIERLLAQRTRNVRDPLCLLLLALMNGSQLLLGKLDPFLIRTSPHIILFTFVSTKFLTFGFDKLLIFLVDLFE